MRLLFSIMLLSLLPLVTGCNSPQHPFPSTLLIIAPYDQDQVPMTGTLAIYKFVDNTFSYPKVLIHCEPEDPNELEDPNHPSSNLYQIYLAQGTYRIIAYDLLHKTQYHQDITINAHTPQRVSITLKP